MKTQRRHELQTNKLADQIGVYLQMVRPYQKQILYGVVAVAVAGAAVLYLSGQQQARAGASWADYFVAMVEQRPEALDEVARLHSGSPAALWARQAAGDMKLMTGASLLYRDRKEAFKNLRDAEKDLLAVEREAAGYPMLLQRARYGLAQTYESLCEVEKARDYFKKVASAEPNSALGNLAQRRHDQLAGRETERWFAWFEKQEPKPPAGAMPADGREPQVPFDLGDLPDRPDSSFPQPPVPAGESSAMPVELTPPATTAPEEPATEPQAKPTAEPQAKPTAEPEAKPAAEPEAKPAAEPEAKPAAEPEAKPVAEPEAKPAAEPEAKPAAEPEAKPVAEPEAKPAAEPEAKPAAEPEAKPVAEPEAVPSPSEPAPVAEEPKQ